MPAFLTLWNNHPHVTGGTPLLDKKVYENQCAINLSAAWMRSGMKLTGFAGAVSWEKDKPKYAIRAQELANWFSLPYSTLARVQKFAGKEAFEKIEGQRGIVFFQNYWGPGNQGDHIDLWNGRRMTDVLSWLRIHARVGSMGLGTDYRNAQSIWFWKMS